MSNRRPRKRPQPVQKPEPKPARRRNVLHLLRRPRVWVTTAVTAVLIAAGLVVRDIAVSELINKDAVADQIRTAEGKPAIQVVRVERFKLLDENQVFARPDGYTLSRSDENRVADLFSDHAIDVIDRAETVGVPVEIATWRLYLRGNRNQSVRILDIRPVNLHRNPPAGGTLFDVPPQGGEQTELMGIDVDTPQPVARSMHVTSGGIGTYVYGGPYFAEKTIKLSDREDQIIMFRAVTRKYDASFSLEIDYQLGDQKLTTTVDNNGQPFRVTGLACRNGRLDYAHYYSLQSGKTYGIYPTNPDDGDFCK